MTTDIRYHYSIIRTISKGIVKTGTHLTNLHDPITIRLTKKACYPSQNPILSPARRVEPRGSLEQL